MNKTRTISLAAAAVVVAAGLYAAFAWLGDGRAQSTDDAYVSADYTVVAPKVSGFVTRVLVDDNQPVHAGQVLAQIDDRDYQAALAAARAQTQVAEARLQDARATLERQAALIEQAQAAVAADQAEQAFAEHELSRHERLAREGAGTVQNAQQARSRIDKARASLARSRASLLATRKQVDVLQAQVASAEGERQHAQAVLDQAQLDLAYTRVTAPIAGTVGQRALRVGAYVTPGTRLLAVVPLEQAYVVGNFRETQLTDVLPGQPVDIGVDTFSGQVLRGHVDSLAPATGVTFAAVKPDNATGNFTKVVQRIPVKIVLEPGQPLLERLRVGMSVVATIDTRAPRDAALDDQGREVSTR
ncbi:HlyD family secretion protein [Pseudomonas mangiferae]|uniref:HlyD family secretion protein n=1 Tax=Pseudomonas mangiferae TaxID=2593654 RepID=A0A553GUI9_9PSED|nr:HlyD family secretion protein [Pseudomonas mangiferae]TRX73188.1 HlyD family secretion protein [Pseudomonas mangiferae]